jgi:hypothetical protein
MKNVVASKKYLSVALAVAAFATVGSVSAFAQSRDHTGSMMPAYYDANGGQVTEGAWGKEQPAPAARHQALRPSRQLIQNAGRSAHTRVQ